MTNMGIYRQNPPRTKVAVTIGPATRDLETVKRIISLGVSIFRLNFSHGDPEEWADYVRIVREASEEMGREVAIIGDLQGPSVRLGKLKEKIVLDRGEKVELFYGYEAGGAGEKSVPVPVELFFRHVSRGDIIVMDDGKAQLIVEDVDEDAATAVSVTSSEIGSRKAMVIRGKDLPLPTISQGDEEAIKFAVSKELDYLGLSYVRDPKDILEVRARLNSLGGGDVRVISKIETVSALKNLQGIIDLSDALLVARGDLGMHFGLEHVPRLQEMIVNECLSRGKPVMVATQLLSSMMDNPVPTRSEITDIVNAVNECVDVLVLTGETATGRYPVETVEWLLRIVATYDPLVKPRRLELPQGASIRDRFTEGVTMLAESLGASIIIYTKTGRTALSVSRNRPRVRVYACTGNYRTLRRMMILWGVQPVKLSSQDYAEGLEEALVKLKSSGDIGRGEVAILVYGMRDEPVNVVKVVQV